MAVIIKIIWTRYIYFYSFLNISVNDNFYILPYLSIGMSTMGFLMSVAGVACSRMESRPALIVYGVVMILLGLSLFGKSDKKYLTIWPC